MEEDRRKDRLCTMGDIINRMVTKQDQVWVEGMMFMLWCLKSLIPPITSKISEIVGGKGGLFNKS